MNEYAELAVNIYLLQDTKMQDANNQIAKFLNYVMRNDTYLSKIHKGNDRFKGYSFSTLYPIEVDKIYKANNIYEITVRSYNIEFINRLSKALDREGNDTLQYIGSSIMLKTCKDIKEIINLTPATATVTENGKTRSWTKKDTSYNIENIIFNNMLKKYNYMNKTNFNFEMNDIIESIEILNNVAMVLNYKQTKVLGYKYRIKFKTNGFAQELARFTMVTGLLEKGSSLGCGFIKVVR